MVPESSTEAIEPLPPEPIVCTTAEPLRAVNRLNAPIAPADDHDTGSSMTPHGLQAKARADVLVANLRSLPERMASARPLETNRVTVAQVLPFRGAAPTITYPPTTRAIGPEHRVCVTIGGLTLAQLLGWSPGALDTSIDGAWVILRPDRSERPTRRNDGRSTLDARSRLRLSAALLTRLGLAVGAEVTVLVRPEHGAIALCNPAWLTVGAPLCLVAAAPNRSSNLEGARP